MDDWKLVILQGMRETIDHIFMRISIHITENNNSWWIYGDIYPP